MKYKRHNPAVGLYIEVQRMNNETHDSCAGCRHDLGGGCCKLNLESECREGGGFEAWERKE